MLGYLPPLYFYLLVLPVNPEATTSLCTLFQHLALRNIRDDLGSAVLSQAECRLQH